MARKRKDPRGEVTRIALLEAAEDLFAERGIDNVTNRQLGQAVGSENNAVVTYYFGSKSGLLQAIYEYRIPIFEARRSELLRLADQLGKGEDALALLYVMWAPIFEQRNGKGRPSFAKFLASTAHSHDVSIIELSRAYPITRTLADRLRKVVGLDERLFWRRLRLISMMVIEAVEDAFVLEGEGLPDCEVNEILSDALLLAKSALTTAPASGEILEGLAGHVQNRGNETQLGSPTAKVR